MTVNNIQENTRTVRLTGESVDYKTKFELRWSRDPKQAGEEPRFYVHIGATDAEEVSMDSVLAIHSRQMADELIAAISFARDVNFTETK